MRIGDHERAGEPRARKRPPITAAGDHDGDRRGRRRGIAPQTPAHGRERRGRDVDRRPGDVTGARRRRPGRWHTARLRSPLGDGTVAGRRLLVGPRPHRRCRRRLGPRRRRRGLHRRRGDRVPRRPLRPRRTEGKRMLAHELAHVEQQRSGPVDGTPAGGGIALSDPGDRFELAASAAAERVGAGGGPLARRSAPRRCGRCSAPATRTSSPRTRRCSAPRRRRNSPKARRRPLGRPAKPLEEETAG